MTRTRLGSLAEGGLNWDSLPLKLFAGGNAKFWDPADIDFSQDRADWQALSALERDWATRLCAEFIAGEEAVARAHFVTTARYEWMFFDAAHRREDWPI